MSNCGISIHFFCVIIFCCCLNWVESRENYVICCGNVDFLFLVFFFVTLQNCDYCVTRLCGFDLNLHGLLDSIFVWFVVGILGFQIRDIWKVYFDTIKVFVLKCLKMLVLEVGNDLEIVYILELIIDCRNIEKSDLIYEDREIGYYKIFVANYSS